MSIFRNLILNKQTVLLVTVLCYICITPIFCCDKRVPQQPQRKHSMKNTIGNAEDIVSPLHSDDPDWQVAGGYSLYAVPAQSRFRFGEDIDVKLLLKNETQMDLIYGDSNVRNVYHVTLYGSSGVIIPELHLDRDGSNTRPSSLRPGESIEQELCLNSMFKFTSSGIYTARVWRYVDALDEHKSVKLYSNEFTFEFYGSPSNAKKTNRNLYGKPYQLNKRNAETIKMKPKTKQN